MRGLFCLLLVISFLALMSGCDEDTTPLEHPLRVVSVAPSGGDIATNSIISVTFNNAMESVRIYVLDSPWNPCFTLTGATHFIGGKTATWTAGGEWESFMPAGEITLMITGTDIFGQELEEYGPISFTMHHPDCAPCMLCMPPRIVGNECDPQDGETGVDPEKYSEEIIIVFSESMGNVEVVDTDPLFNFTANLNERAFTISFLDGYTMPYETRYSIELSGADLAGNSIMGYDWEKCEPELPEYSFTTKAEGQ